MYEYKYINTKYQNISMYYYTHHTDVITKYRFQLKKFHRPRRTPSIRNRDFRIICAISRKSMEIPQSIEKLIRVINEKHSVAVVEEKQ